MNAVHFGEIRPFKREHPEQPDHEVFGRLLKSISGMGPGTSVSLRTEDVPFSEDMQALQEAVPYVLLTGPDKDHFMSGENEGELMEKIVMTVRALNMQA